MRSFASLPLQHLLPGLLLISVACGPAEVYRPDDAGTDAGVDGGADAGVDGGADGGSDGGSGPRLPLPADRLRYGVVSHPRDAAGAESDVYQVFTVDEWGAVAPTNHSFRMGRSGEGEIVFTPDGEIGIVPQIDGTLGVFKLAADGTPTVIWPALEGTYANQVVMGPRGERAWVVDFNWEVNGGGIYELAIGADDTVTVVGRILEGRSLGRMVLLSSGTEALVAGRGVGGTLDAADLFLIDLTVSPPALLSSVDLFGDDDLMASSIELTPDERFVLVGDNSVFSGTGQRVGVARIESDLGLTAQPQLPDPLWPPQPPLPPIIEDPTGIFASPHGSRIAVVCGTGDMVLSLTWDATVPDGAFAIEEIVPRAEPGPALPFGSTMIRRGALNGRVLIAELQHVRSYQFETDGTITDLGRTALDATPLVLGAIGIQP